MNIGNQQGGGPDRQAHSRVAGAKPRLCWHHSKKQKENTAALGSRHRRVCLVMSSARPRINLMFLSSPTRGSAEMAAAGYRRHRHGIISRMRYMQVIQYSSCIVVRIPSGRMSYIVGFDYYLGKASRLSSAERGTSGTAPVRGTARRNQVLSGSGGSGNRQGRTDRAARADRRFVVLLLQGSDSAFYCSTRLRRSPDEEVLSFLFSLTHVTR